MNTIDDIELFDDGTTPTKYLDQILSLILSHL
jgi:hypothetical protein